MLQYLLIVYGSFLMLCGITAVTFIGMKAKTALISGGFAATMSFIAAYLYSIHSGIAPYFGIFVTLALMGVFAWRSTKTLFTVFKLIPEQSSELNGKGIAFLIISLMCVTSVFASILQILFVVA